MKVSLAVLGRQLAAMPCRLYEVRLIHSGSHKPYPGVRQWTRFQLSDPATVGFLRIRNREGYDVYFRPYAGNHNAGYILLDLDDPPERGTLTWPIEYPSPSAWRASQVRWIFCFF